MPQNKHSPNCFPKDQTECDHGFPQLTKVFSNAGGSPCVQVMALKERYHRVPAKINPFRASSCPMYAQKTQTQLWLATYLSRPPLGVLGAEEYGITF